MYRKSPYTEDNYFESQESFASQETSDGNQDLTRISDLILNTPNKGPWDMSQSNTKAKRLSQTSDSKFNKTAELMMRGSNLKPNKIVNENEYSCFSCCKTTEREELSLQLKVCRNCSKSICQECIRECQECRKINCIPCIQSKADKFNEKLVCTECFNRY